MDATTFTWGMFFGFVVGTLIARLTIRSAYNCGVMEGYGFSKKPFAPDYQDAGDYLKEYHSDRWPELASLPEDDEPWSDDR